MHECFMECKLSTKSNVVKEEVNEKGRYKRMVKNTT